MPDGVFDPMVVAASVAADLKSAHKMRKLAPPPPPEARNEGLLAPEDIQIRRRLLEGARRGDPVAARELMRRYRCWLIPGARGKA